MKALFYNGTKICDETESLCDMKETYEKVTGNYLVDDINDYLEANYTPMEMVDLSEYEVLKEYAEACWDEQIVGFEVRELNEENEGEEEEDEVAEPVKDCVTGKSLVPTGAVPGVIGYNKAGGYGELKYKPLAKPGHMTKGCPICDGMLKVLGKSETMGRMPVLYPCICQRSGCQIVVADDEGYGPIVEDE